MGFNTDRDRGHCGTLTLVGRGIQLSRSSDAEWETTTTMLAKWIIRCLDVHAGRVVKGVNFVNLRDAGDPVDIAAGYEEAGADELVFLDITASHEGRDIMLEVVRRTSEVIFMPLTVGGGIRTLDDIRCLLEAGCDKVSINSSAVSDPDLVREAALRFGSQCGSLAGNRPNQNIRPNISGNRKAVVPADRVYSVVAA